MWSEIPRSPPPPLALSLSANVFECLACYFRSFRHLLVRTRVQEIVFMVAGFEIDRKMHSQLKADILVCRPPNELTAHTIIKQIHVSAYTLTTSIPGMFHEGEIVQPPLQMPPRDSIVWYHSVIDPAQVSVVVMEFWILNESQGRINEPQALLIFDQALRDVQSLHAQDIVHCDVSLENLLVADDCSVRLCDFGLACCASTLSVQRIGKFN